MADLSDVANTLKDLCASLVYPNGTAQPSVANAPIQVYVGWPVKSQLDADLAIGKCHVSVYPRPQERNTTRYLPTSAQVSLNTALLTLTVSGQTVTVAGTIPPVANPHNLAIFVNGLPYVYRVLVTDTLATIASAMAALIPGASSAGPIIIVQNTARLGAARVGVTGTSGILVRNQERVFQIGIWADTPAHRDAIATGIDPTLAATTFLSFADGTAGRFRYVGSPVTDMFEKSTLYRRDLMYSVDYSTMQVQSTTQITQISETVQAGPNSVTVYQ